MQNVSPDHRIDIDTPDGSHRFARRVDALQFPRNVKKAFDPDEPRDEAGRWSNAGSNMAGWMSPSGQPHEIVSGRPILSHRGRGS